MNHYREKEIYKKLYYPKRKVNNKNSNALPHIMGAYNSEKMDERIEFESQSELDAFLIFELSSVVWGYYPQPVEVPVKFYDKKGRLKSWIHIPDVLVFAENSKPCLYQIKGEISKSEVKPRFMNTTKACLDIAKDNKWDYKLIHMKTLNKNFRWNIRFLYPFLNHERANEEFSKSILSMLRENQTLTIDELANWAVPNIEKQFVLPVIYHELAKGILYVDLFERINSKSLIRLARDDDADYYQYIWEVQ